MSYFEDLHEFAEEYLEIYSDLEENYYYLENEFADRCEYLDLKMDCGKGYERLFPDTLQDLGKFENSLEIVKDPELLGSAIFSQWRYVTYWSGEGFQGLKNEFYRSWFIMAFKKLKELTENPCYIEKPEKSNRIRIRSNCMCYGPGPEIGEEIEQHITVGLDGKVEYTAFMYEEKAVYRRSTKEEFRISPEDAAKLLSYISDYFADESHLIPLATDIGSWDILISNESGEQYYTTGSLYEDLFYKEVGLSQLVREILKCPYLMVFDGRDLSKSIEKICIDYGRTVLRESVKSKYTESITIDRQTETIEYLRRTAEGYELKNLYYVKDEIGPFLDSIDPIGLFGTINDFDETVSVSEHDNDAVYQITVDFAYGDSKTFEGWYDKTGLPSDWDHFIEKLLDFLHSFGEWELFKAKQYNKHRRKKGDYIFLSVIFDEWSKEYYYLTDDDSIEEYDEVLVPVGKNNKEEIVEVVKKEYFAESEVPMPLEKVKKVIRKL